MQKNLDGTKIIIIIKMKKYSKFWTYLSIPILTNRIMGNFDFGAWAIGLFIMKQYPCSARDYGKSALK